MKIRYNHRYILATGLVTLFSFAINGCKNYLDVNPQGQISESAIATNPSAANDLVTGVYNVFFTSQPFGPDIFGFQFVILTDIASDDADKGSSPDDYAEARLIDNLQFNASIGIFNNIWNGHYRGIARANQALDKLANAEFDETTKNTLIGEVRFLRALFYFNLVRMFGGVPLVDRVPLPSEANSEQFSTRATAEQIYELIIADLQFAETNLPLKSATVAGRATKGAAQGLLAKVYLYQKNYQAAYDEAQKVIASNQYAVYQDYATLWRQTGNNNSESMFEIQAGTNTACNAAMDSYTIAQGPRAGGKRGWADLGYGFNNPSQSLVNAYEEGDVRKEASIIFITPTAVSGDGPNPANAGTVLFDGYRIPSQDSVENQRYSYKAYHSRTAEANCGNLNFLPKNIRVLRYSDLLLIHAEAAVQLGRSAEAVADLAQVHAHATTSSTVAPTLEGIWQERRVELALEHDRYFDLVRQNSVQPGRAAAAFAADGNKSFNARNALFPIPQVQIDLSGGKLQQNPGY